jgi:hypothetical protein
VLRTRTAMTLNEGGGRSQYRMPAARLSSTASQEYRGQYQGLAAVVLPHSRNACRGPRTGAASGEWRTGVSCQAAVRGREVSLYNAWPRPRAGCASLSPHAKLRITWTDVYHHRNPRIPNWILLAVSSKTEKHHQMCSRQHTSSFPSSVALPFTSTTCCRTQRHTHGLQVPR